MKIQGQVRSIWHQWREKEKALVSVTPSRECDSQTTRSLSLSAPLIHILSSWFSRPLSGLEFLLPNLTPFLSSHPKFLAIDIGAHLNIYP